MYRYRTDSASNGECWYTSNAGTQQCDASSENNDGVFCFCTRGAAPAVRWIKLSLSSGIAIPSGTLFGDVPRAPGDGDASTVTHPVVPRQDTWVVETDVGFVHSGWSDCRSRGKGDGGWYPNNLLRCRLFWKSLSSYVLAGHWKCGKSLRLFDNYRVDGHHNKPQDQGGGFLTLDQCFERCLAHPKCKYFFHGTAPTTGFCGGCSDYYVPGEIGSGEIFYEEPFNYDTYLVRTPLDSPTAGRLVGLTDNPLSPARVGAWRWGNPTTQKGKSCTEICQSLDDGKATCRADELLWEARVGGQARKFFEKHGADGPCTGDFGNGNGASHPSRGVDVNVGFCYVNRFSGSANPGCNNFDASYVRLCPCFSRYRLDGSLKVIWTNQARALPTGTRLSYHVLVQGTGTIELAFHCNQGGIQYFSFEGLTTPTWLTKTAVVTDLSDECTDKAADILFARFVDVSSKTVLYRVRTETAEPVYADGGTDMISSYTNVVTREATLAEMLGAWNTAVTTVGTTTTAAVNGADLGAAAVPFLPRWEYYGRREQHRGALPAVTKLAGPSYRRCNYNVDFRGQSLRLRVDDSCTQPAGNQCTATIDCGMEDVRGPFAPSTATIVAASRNYGVAWLDFPRRGLLLGASPSEAKSQVIVGPGVVVEHCSTNALGRWASIRSHPGPGPMSLQRDGNAGGGILVVGSAANFDDPTAGELPDLILRGVTIRRCSADRGGGIYAENARVEIHDASVVECGWNEASAMEAALRSDVRWNGGTVAKSGSFGSGAILLAPREHVASASFVDVTFEDNAIGGSAAKYPDGGAVSVLV